MPESTEKPLRAVLVGCEPEVVARVRSELGPTAEFKLLEPGQDFDAGTEGIDDASTDLIVCGPGFGEMSAVELAQYFTTLAPGARLILATARRDRYDFKALAKNGFREEFCLPADDVHFGEFLRRVRLEKTGQARPVYRSVPMTDLEPGEKVDFSLSLYLPVNDKHVKIVRAGDAIEAKMAEKMRRHHVQQLHVEERELPNFVAYSSQKLRDLRGEAARNPAAKGRLQDLVRGLYRDILGGTTGDFDEGRSLMETTNQIVSDFLGAKSARDAFARMVGSHSVTDDTIYARSLRVSNLAALLSLLTEVGRPEDLALVGLFHNLGQTTLSPELVRKDRGALDADELRQWRGYPEASLKLLLEKKMILGPNLQKVIAQQLERADGRGFPKGLNHLKLEPETPVLQLAMALDELCGLRPGAKRVSIGEALAHVESSGAISLEFLIPARKAVAAAS